MEIYYSRFFMGVMGTDYHSGEAIIIAPYLEWMMDFWVDVLWEFGFWIFDRELIKIWLNIRGFAEKLSSGDFGFYLGFHLWFFQKSTMSFPLAIFGVHNFDQVPFFSTQG